MSEQELTQRIEYLEKYVRTLTNRIGKLEEDLRYGKIQFPHGPVFAEVYERLAKLESVQPEEEPTDRSDAPELDDEEVARQEEYLRKAGYPIDTPINLSAESVARQEPETHSGVCKECERYTSALGPTGLCEGCVMQAAIDAMEES